MPSAATRPLQTAPHGAWGYDAGQRDETESPAYFSQEGYVIIVSFRDIKYENSGVFFARLARFRLISRPCGRMRRRRRCSPSVARGVPAVHLKALSRFSPLRAHETNASGHFI